MNSTSKAFRVKKFIRRMLDETIEKDEQYIKINHEILRLEKELLPLLTPDARNTYLKIDELVSKQDELVSSILYRKFYDNYDKLTIILRGKNSKI